MGKNFVIVGIGGSLRKGSLSMAVMRSAVDLIPKGAEMEIADLAEIPVFNQDYETSPPEPVRRLKEQIKRADAVLFVTPEYNFGLPGYLKNAIDWASRPYGDNSFEGKAGAIISSSNGMLGGIKAQLQLRQSLVYLDVHALNDSIAISNVDKKLGPDGKLADERTVEHVKEMLADLVEWAGRIKK